MQIVNPVLKFMRGAVRPTVAILFVVAQVTLAVMWGLPPSVVAISAEQTAGAFAALVPFTMKIINDYFESRPDRSDDT